MATLLNILSLNDQKADETVDLFPQDQFIPLLEILTTVNYYTGFLEGFEHWKIKNNRGKPQPEVFFGGIIGYGCNIGIGKMGKISKNLNPNELENIVNWYFTTENLNQANDRIIGFLNKLKLPNVYRKWPHLTHTSSDGQKYNVRGNIVFASYSFKSSGKDQGVSVKTFIDEGQRLFHSTVMNSAEREAHYVIDGLMHNEVVQSDIHSTDTHGYSEIIFGVTHLIGISFAPRIKNFKKQHLYAFIIPREYRELGYSILPRKKINLKLIEDQWDEILRFVATIKLKHTTASQLFRRLSFYSKQHPLYRALKEFGRIIKSIFLLQYIDQLELRQAIEIVLSRVENTNQFSRAVFNDRNQEFPHTTREQQLIADSCKRLIQNSIVCWNYLYLSQRLCEMDSDKEKQRLVQAIKRGSVIAWQHINLQGEYDFSPDHLSNNWNFRLPEILELNVS